MSSLELASSSGRRQRTVPGRRSDVCSGKPLRAAGRRIDGQIVPSATSAEASLDRSFATDLSLDTRRQGGGCPQGLAHNAKEHYAGATREPTRRYMRQPQYWMVVSRDVSCMVP